MYDWSWGLPEVGFRIARAINEEDRTRILHELFGSIPQEEIRILDDAFMTLIRGDLLGFIRVRENPVLKESPTPQIQQFVTYLNGIFYDMTGNQAQALQQFNRLPNTHPGAIMRERIRYEKGLGIFHIQSANLTLEKRYWWETTSEEVKMQIKYWTSLWEHIFATKIHIVGFVSYIREAIELLELAVNRMFSLFPYEFRRLRVLLFQLIPQQFQDNYFIRTCFPDFYERISVVTTYLQRQIDLSQHKLTSWLFKYILQCLKALHQTINANLSFEFYLQNIKFKFTLDPFPPRQLKWLNLVTENILASLIEAGYSRKTLIGLPDSFLDYQGRDTSTLIENRLDALFNHLLHMLQEEHNIAVHFELEGISTSNPLPEITEIPEVTRVRFYNRQVEDPFTTEMPPSPELPDEFYISLGIPQDHIQDYRRSVHEQETRNLRARVELRRRDPNRAIEMSKINLIFLLDFISYFYNHLDGQYSIRPNFQYAIDGAHSGGQLSSTPQDRMHLEPLNLTPAMITRISQIYQHLIGMENLTVFQREVINFIHWLKKGIDSPRTVDRFLNFWIALEFLAKGDANPDERVNAFIQKVTKPFALFEVVNLYQKFYMDFSNTYLTKFADILRICAGIADLEKFPEEFQIVTLFQHLGEFLEFIEDPRLKSQAETILENTPNQDLNWLKLLNEEQMRLLELLYLKRNMIVHKGESRDPELEFYLRYLEKKLQILIYHIIEFLLNRRSTNMNDFWDSWNQKFDNIIQELTGGAKIYTKLNEIFSLF